MSDPKDQERYHAPRSIADHPMIKEAMQVIGALLMAIGAEDLEVDFFNDRQRRPQPHIPFRSD